MNTEENDHIYTFSTESGTPYSIINFDIVYTTALVVTNPYATRCLTPRIIKSLASLHSSDELLLLQFDSCLHSHF